MNVLEKVRQLDAERKKMEKVCKYYKIDENSITQDGDKLFLSIPFDNKYSEKDLIVTVLFLAEYKLAFQFFNDETQQHEWEWEQMSFHFDGSLFNFEAQFALQ